MGKELRPVIYSPPDVGYPFIVCWRSPGGAVELQTFEDFEKAETFLEDLRHATGLEDEDD